jgi:Lrp/AsnC family transcriptional regulator for asnA, asnC and gidA
MFTPRRRAPRGEDAAPVQQPPFTPDAVDREIIAELQKDGRCTNASIARAVKMSESAVKARIERLMANDVLRVLAVLNPVRLGLTADTLVGINVKPGRLLNVGEQLRRVNEVIYIGYVSGRYDLLIEVLAADSEDLLDFLSSRLAHIDDIVSMETFFIMRNEKINYEWKLPEILPEDEG